MFCSELYFILRLFSETVFLGTTIYKIVLGTLGDPNRTLKGHEPLHGLRFESYKVLQYFLCYANGPQQFSDNH